MLHGGGGAVSCLRPSHLRGLDAGSGEAIGGPRSRRDPVTLREGGTFC